MHGFSDKLARVACTEPCGTECPLDEFGRTDPIAYGEACGVVQRALGTFTNKDILDAADLETRAHDARSVAGLIGDQILLDTLDPEAHSRILKSREDVRAAAAQSLVRIASGECPNYWRSDGSCW